MLECKKICFDLSIERSIEMFNGLLMRIRQIKDVCRYSSGVSGNSVSEVRATRIGLFRWSIGCLVDSSFCNHSLSSKRHVLVVEEEKVEKIVLSRKTRVLL